MIIMKDHLPQGSEPHHTRYIRFIESRPKRVWKLKSGLVRHHILPVSIGGARGFKAEPDNIIVLTNREHFIAHLILWKCYGSKMAQAFFYFMNGQGKNPSGKHGRSLTSKQYAVLRLDSSKQISSILKGKPTWIKGTKGAISKESLIQRGQNVSKTIRENYPNGRPSAFKNHQHTTESKQLLSDARLGKTSWNKGKKTGPIKVKRTSEHATKIKERMTATKWRMRRQRWLDELNSSADDNPYKGKRILIESLEFSHTDGSKIKMPLSHLPDPQHRSLW